MGSYYIHGVNVANAVLPVTLVDFYGVKSNGVHQLTWVVAQEEQCLDYQLQSSSDAIHFTTITSIPCRTHSQSADTIKYEATNNAVKSGHTYYRLQQTDIDGHCRLLPKQVDLFEDVNPLSFQCFPNPADQEIVIECIADKILDANILITDMNGNSIKRDNVRLKNGVNKFGMDVSSWPKGIYSLALYENAQLKGVVRILKR